MKELNISPEIYYESQEVEKMLGVTRTTLHRYRTQGLIQFYRWGNRVRYLGSDLLDFIQSFQRGGKRAA